MLPVHVESCLDGLLPNYQHTCFAGLVPWLLHQLSLAADQSRSGAHMHFVPELVTSFELPCCAYTEQEKHSTQQQNWHLSTHCHHYHQVSQPTLQLFLSSALIVKYVSFHIAACHSHLYIRNFLSCAKHVLRWWQSKPGGKHPSFVEGLEWLQTLGLQVMCC